MEVTKKLRNLCWLKGETHLIIVSQSLSITINKLIVIYLFNCGFYLIKSAENG